MIRRIIVVVAFGLLMARPLLATGLSFPSFQSDITVNTDASITVTETITADFSTPHHGIFRVIPYRYTTTNGSTASIPVAVGSVQHNGAVGEFTTTTDGTNVTVKIGDPDRLISGRHIYTITYTAQAATNFFTDHDELYWNVTGDQWDEPLTNITATVVLPDGITAAASVATTCYTGTSGSTEQNCEQSHTTDAATFSSADYLTIAVSWPTGLVTKPANFDDLRSQGTTSPPSPIFQRPTWWVVALNMLVIVAALASILRHWYRHGRDPQRRATIIAQYDPPDNLRPAELYALMHEQAPMKRLIPATIIDLAVRGYVHIREVQKATFLGLGQAKDYELQRMKPADATLRPFEKSVLTTLFDKHHVTDVAQQTIALSELKQRKYTTNPFGAAMGSVMSHLASERYFAKNPTTAKVVVGVVGMLVLGVTAFVLSAGVFAWGGTVAGLIILGFIPAMPQRSAKGVEAVWVGHGFQLFLEKAEQYRIHWQEREHIFERFLPYAMVFGIADKWSTALADVAKQPDWYSGSSDQVFSSIVFVSAMNSFSSVTTNAVVSAAASGSSGMSGGSSGGGGGGGGGGGW